MQKIVFFSHICVGVPSKAYTPKWSMTRQDYLDLKKNKKIAGHVLPAYIWTHTFIIICSKNIYKVWITILNFLILGSKDTSRPLRLIEELHAFDMLRPKHLGTALFPMLLFLSGILCFVKLTPSLIRCHLKTTNTIGTFETLKHFCLLFRTGMWKGFHQNA